MLTFTLDINCIIDVAEERPAAGTIRRMIMAHDQGKANVALVAVSASERQQGDVYLENFGIFEHRVAALGFGSLPLIMGMAYWNVGYYGMGLWADEAMAESERAIHEVLFPNVSFGWADYAALAGIDVETGDRLPEARKWRNAFCDRQMFWAHTHHRRDVFVTSDRNFRKLQRSKMFAAAKIMTPEEAAALLRQVAGDRA